MLKPNSLARARFISIWALAALSLAALTAPARAETATFAIEPQDLSSALKAFAVQSHREIFFAPELARGRMSHGVKGKLDDLKALNIILEGTGLNFSVTASNAILVRDPTSKTESPRSTSLPASAPASAADPPVRVAPADQNAAGPQVTGGSDGQNSDKRKKEKEEGLSEIIVTGTLIHNAEPLSPLITITHDDMLAQGYSRLDQVIEQLPQNFMAGASAQSNPTTQQGEGASGNYSRGSGINLRGLGSNATLVLLNGQRLAMSNVGDSVDISMIPVSIIDRVEILTDGASAIYGADAVAGVVNIITRNDYSGIEIGVRDTNLSSGKAPNPGGHALGGFNWTGGNLVVNYDFEKDHPLYTRDRSYTSMDGDPTTILPEQKTSSLFAALRQELGAAFAMSSNVLFGRRDYSVVHTSPFNQVVLNTNGDSKQFSGGVQLDYHLEEWHASVAGHYAKEDGLTLLDRVGSNVSRTLINHDSGVDLRVDRSLFELPGGPSHVALGATFRSEAIDSLDTSFIPLPPSSQELRNSRNSRSVFGELLLPLLGDRNGIPLVEALTADIAGRYDRYNDFGSTFNPKFALKWQLPGGLSAHAVYGRSFRVPTLYENIPTLFGGAVVDVPDPQSPVGTTRVLEYGSNNPRLQPERARSVNAGLTFAPASLPSLKVDVSYFDILFTNKIEQLAALGFYNNVLTNEAQLGSLVTRNPSLAAVNAILNEPGSYIDFSGISNPDAFTPDQVKALVNVGSVNAAIVHPRGVDIAARYRWNMGNLGHVSLDGSASYYISYDDQIAPGASSYSAINLPYLPTRFRGKMQLGWDRSGWAVYSRVNFTSAYSNPTTGDPACAVSCPVASWTTIDAGFSYSVTRKEGVGFLEGTQFRFDVSNVFDRAPPYVYDPGFNNYDPTNASALQRAFSIAVTKAF